MDYARILHVKMHLIVLKSSNEAGSHTQRDTYGDVHTHRYDIAFVIIKWLTTILGIPYTRKTY